jgi:hypothetical protein
MGRACRMNDEKRNAYRILVEKPEGRRSLGRPRRKLEDNIVTCIFVDRKQFLKTNTGKNRRETVFYAFVPSKSMEI